MIGIGMASVQGKKYAILDTIFWDKRHPLPSGYPYWASPIPVILMWFTTSVQFAISLLLTLQNTCVCCCPL